jgi:hypothetical protein
MMRKFLFVTLVLASLGCAFQLPASRTVVASDGRGDTVVPIAYSDLCLEAVRQHNAWNATSIVFNALGTASSGAVVTSEFLTDEEWVPAAFSIGGLIFGGIGIGAGLVADEAEQDVLMYCGESL